LGGRVYSENTPTGSVGFWQEFYGFGFAVDDWGNSNPQVPLLSAATRKYEPLGQRRKAADEQQQTGTADDKTSTVITW
jgi:hypothetical protein